MDIPFVTQLYRQRCRRRIRTIMRGHRILKKSGQLNLVSRIKEEFAGHELDIPKEFFSKFLMGVGANSGEMVVRQYLLMHVGDLNLNQALMHSLGGGRSVLFPLPKEWRNVLEKHGFKVAHVRSAILWQCYILAIWMHGIVKIGKVFISGVVAQKKDVSIQENYAYFVGLVPSNLPQKINNIKSYDVISWYLQWSGRGHGVEAICHSAVQSECINVDGINISSQSGPLPALNGWAQALKYAAWACGAVVIATFDCLRGRWWHALLLNQAALAFQARIVPVESLAREYLFNNSGLIYRPLWTYEAELRGSIILLYFYATNYEGFKTSKGYPPIDYGCKVMNWPHYLVWDEYQADFIQRAVGEMANISVVGPIWFQSNNINMPIFDNLCIAVFDSTPQRSSRYATLGMENDFHEPMVANLFLKHISNIVEKKGALMLWKKKRDMTFWPIRALAHPHYRFLANLIADKATTFMVDPSQAASRVIESSQAVISIPFTSTGLLAKEMGKPSIYYDPTGQLHRDDRAAHGIPILSGIEELEEWISAQIAIQQLTR